MAQSQAEQQAQAQIAGEPTRTKERQPQPATGTAADPTAQAQQNDEQGGLERKMETRHLTMISLGGVIGTGLFLSSGYTIHQAGPLGAIIAYAIGSVLVYFIMLSLGELSVAMPYAGSFHLYAKRFIGPGTAFTIAVLYWLNWAVALASEFTAAGLLMQRWFPHSPAWVWSAAFIVVVFLLNILSVRLYGESEFWFASIKVFAIIAFIIIGLLAMFGAIPIAGYDHAPMFENFYSDGWLPNGVLPIFSTLLTVVFAFSGTEVVGVAAKQGHTNTSHSREDALAQEDVAPIRVGLLGAGTVGSQTARLLVEQKDELAARIGRPIELTGVACLDPAETDPFPWIDKAIVTTDTMSVATNSDIVIELIGGTGVARKFVLAAIESGASVVTANKALLAKYGPEIYAAAEAKGVDIYFEASVGGAIPFLKPLRESLVGDKVTSMLGIVNGTTNYILDEMTTKGLDFDDVLKDAQAKGYAEADPTGDIEGYDAANKAAIMATLGFHTSVTIDDVSVEGITKITADDIAAATAENKVIKLLAVVENTDAGVSARVYPALISNTHPLASVHGSFNAVFVKAEAADDLMFYGRGAGGAPTASAVVGDVVTEARHIAQGCTGPSIPLYKDLKKAPIEASKAEFAVRFVIHDNPGVLAAIAAKFADHGVSINGVNQDLKPTLKDPGYDGELQQLRLVTHMTDELTLRETVKDVCELDCVCGEPSILRVLN